MMANDLGLDYERIRHAIKYEYPRANDLPGAGFAAGPCLFKDTMQLSAVSSNNFFLGHSAMLVNEGLPAYVVDKLEEKYGSLKDKNIGILGMAFKGGSDDIRSSLSYKLKRQLDFKAKSVKITDPLVSLETEPRLLNLQEVLDSSDILIIGAPHKEYRSLNTKADIVDIWNVQNSGVLI
jgi:UDP-N-acetyl-D-mannosaminuronic acid dehydrogenase